MASTAEVVYGADIGSSQSRRVFREILLGPTLARAQSKSLFYRDSWEAVPLASIRRVEDLPHLPLVAREKVAARFSDLLILDEPTALLQQTTGTGGRSMGIYRSASELSFIHAFFSKANAGHRPAQLPVVLTLADAYHGPSLSIPANVFPLQIGMTDDTHLREAHRILGSSLAIPGVAGKVSILVGLVPYIKTLTQYLVEKSFDFSECGVELICPICTVLTDRWRAILEDTWGAKVVERYSLSEVFGGATSGDTLIMVSLLTSGILIITRFI